MMHKTGKAYMKLKIAEQQLPHRRMISVFWFQQLSFHARVRHGVSCKSRNHKQDAPTT